MNNTLSYCEFKMNIYNFDNVSDNVLKDLIVDCDKDDVMFNIFFKYVYQLNPDKVSEVYDYFVNLVDKIANVSGFDYSEDELKTYRMFAIPTHYRNVLNEEDLLKFISSYEEVDSLTASNDSMLYAQECVRYRLLQLYVEDLTKYYDKMKALLARLKKSKDKYKELEDAILEKLSNKER